MTASRKAGGQLGGQARTAGASKRPARKSAELRPAQALNLDILPSLLGFHVRLASLEIYRDFTEKTAEIGLTQKQAAVLTLIGANPGTSQIMMAKFLGTDRATMMAMVNRLEAAKLIERRASETDRRRSALVLTRAGAVALEDLKARLARHEKKFTGRFSTAELAQFMEFLNRLHKKL